MDDIKEEALETLKQLGLNEHDIDNIFKGKNFSRFISFNNHKLYPRIIENIAYLQQLGYSQDNLIYIIKKNGSVLLYPAENMQKVFDYLSSINFSKEDIIRITTYMPNKLNEPVESIKKQKGLLESKGLDMLKISRSYPQIIRLSGDLLEEKLKILQEYGLNNPEIINQAPTILAISSETLKSKMKYIENLGVYKRDLIKNPILLLHLSLMSLENTKERIKLYKKMKIDISDKNYNVLLSQNIDLIYSKYSFLKNDSRSSKTLNSYLLLSNEEFCETFDVEINELLKKYPYKDKDKKKKKNEEDVER